MNIQTIDSLYNDIVQQSSGAKKIKVDLHIHTPASKDFVYKPLSIEDAYINILDNAIENNIEIIAITDHNTFKGYRKIKEILSDLSVSKKI